MSADSDSWGVHPVDALARLQQREWDDSARLRARLLDERPFPIRLSLRPPTARQALAGLDRFQRWIAEWKAFSPGSCLDWQSRRFRQLGEQQIPASLHIATINELAAVLGVSAQNRMQGWEPRMLPLLALANDRHKAGLYRALVRSLGQLERLSVYEVDLLARVLPQLQAQMGDGCYLRALPITGVDTKFVERQRGLLRDLLDVLHDGAVSEAGSLFRWLDCQESPKAWLVVRPLCDATRSALGGLSLLQLTVQEILARPLPAGQILVVENLQSALALPETPGTIAIAGGGRNVSWLAASWFERCRVAYWGDIDSWGLYMLGDARSHCPHITPLMMDRQTLDVHQNRMVDEPEPCSLSMELKPEEQVLLGLLREGGVGRTRLEQERLSPDWIHSALQQWLAE